MSEAPSHELEDFIFSLTDSIYIYIYTRGRLIVIFASISENDEKKLGNLIAPSSYRRNVNSGKDPTVLDHGQRIRNMQNRELMMKRRASRAHCQDEESLTEFFRKRDFVCPDQKNVNIFEIQPLIKKTEKRANVLLYTLWASFFFFYLLTCNKIFNMY